jgi:hypothetical protein
MIPKDFKEIEIYDNVSEHDLLGTFLFNPTWNEGGFFHYGNDKGFGLSNGSHYNTITGDNLYDQIKINNFKVYANNK